MTAAPRILQIVLGSDDLPFAKHLYSTVFGFAVAGERLIFSEHNGQAMGFGGFGGAAVLYMVGRQELMQLEFWTHTRPRQRPLSDGWRPDDIGPCRFGIAVPDFDAVLERLAALGVATLTEAAIVDGLRRVCFRDPTVGVPVEIMEEGLGLPGRRDHHHDLKPAIAYVALSVADLEEAVDFFGGVVGLEQVDVQLHTADQERLWGLTGARREVATLRGGTSFLELVRYDVPGRALPVGGVLDRQGFKAFAVGDRDPAVAGGVFARVRAAGLGWTVADPASFIGGNHAIGAVAHQLKTLSVPHELEREFAFSPEPPKWWGGPTQPAKSQSRPITTRPAAACLENVTGARP